ncbi:MAG TPA: SDR family oxidoreductase [Stellaceae bacterium]|nr:SDR family oxidoreductase [Stellaceae bacterium]
MGLLDGKVAIVTGAASGLGAGCARRYVAEGAKVVLTDIREEAVRASASGTGGDALGLRHDVSSEDDWRRVIDETLSKHGTIDVLINNAAVYDRCSLAETDAATMERFFRVNQLGPFLGMKAVLDTMRRAGGGAIINMASVAGLSGYPDIFAYGTSKWTVRGMTRYAARDLGRYGIRVNAILPGVIETPMIAGVDDQIVASWLATMPLGRLGKPDDIASVAVFLGSDLSRYMTGADVVVDAGQVA